MIGESGRSVGPDGHGSGGLQGGRLSLNGRICERKKQEQSGEGVLLLLTT